MWQIYLKTASFNNSVLYKTEFYTKWKKANVVPVHKKVTNRFKKTIDPHLYFRFAEKIFERLLYNRLYEYFIENELISSSQPGFKPVDLCINQLSSITHDLLKSDSGP